MIGDDLAPLLAPGRAPDVGFRQGTVVTFDQGSGHNSVSVAGALLSDLPILSGAESLEYEVGDVVVLIRLNSSWAILGRVVTPGAAPLATSALTTGHFNGFASNFGLTTSLVDRGADTVAVPPWATRAALTVTSCLSVLNGSAAARQIGVQAKAHTTYGPGGLTGQANFPVGAMGCVADTVSTTVDFTAGGLATVSVSAGVLADAAIPASTATRVITAGIVVFTRP